MNFKKLLKSKGFSKLSKDQDCLEIINLIFPQLKNISIFSKLNNFAQKNFSKGRFHFFIIIISY